MNGRKGVPLPTNVIVEDPRVLNYLLTCDADKRTEYDVMLQILGNFGEHEVVDFLRESSGDG